MVIDNILYKGAKLISIYDIPHSFSRIGYKRRANRIYIIRKVKVSLNDTRTCSVTTDQTRPDGSASADIIIQTSLKTKDLPGKYWKGFILYDKLTDEEKLMFELSREIGNIIDLDTVT